MWQSIVALAKAGAAKAKIAGVAWLRTGQAKIILVLLVLLALLTWRLNVAWKAERAAAVDGENATLRMAGLFTAQLKTAGDLRTDLAEALKHSKALADALEAAQKKGAGKPVEVVHEETKPLPVAPAAGDSAGCALRVDELGVIKRDAVTLKAEFGNRTLVTELSAWRAAGKRPAERLFSDLLSIPLSSYDAARETVVEEASLGGWAWGVAAGGASKIGGSLGLAVSPPPFRVPLVGGRGVLFMSGGTTIHGDVQATVAVLRRGD